jgi:hypothetical protein
MRLRQPARFVELGRTGDRAVDADPEPIDVALRRLELRRRLLVRRGRRRELLARRGVRRLALGEAPLGALHLLQELLALVMPRWRRLGADPVIGAERLVKRRAAIDVLVRRLDALRELAGDGRIRGLYVVAAVRFVIERSVGFDAVINLATIDLVFGGEIDL